MFYTEGALSLPVRPGNMGFLIYRDGYSIFLDICNSGKSRKGWWLGYFLINWKKIIFLREVPAKYRPGFSGCMAAWHAVPGVYTEPDTCYCSSTFS